MRATIVLLACVIVAGSSMGHVHAQSYPNRPLRFVIPFPPGGGADNLARIVAQKVGETMGQQLVIDNRAGAGGNIAAEVVAKAAPDGYTLLQGNVAHAISTSLYRRLNYDIVKDFAPVTQLASIPFILVVNPSLPVHSVKELIAMAKARPGELNYASAGSGTPLHLAAELFKTMGGVNIVHVPYKGNAPAFLDLISGQVSLSFPTIPSALPHVRSGKLRALAVTSKQRSRVVPEIPTMAESGLPGYDSSSWFGVLAPAGTPASVVTNLQQAIVKVLQQADVRDRLLSQGLDPVGSTPGEFAATIKSEIAKWAKVVQASGARVD